MAAFERCCKPDKFRYTTVLNARISLVTKALDGLYVHCRVLDLQEPWTGLLAESFASPLIGSDCPQEVDFAKFRPVDVKENEFAVRCLPQEKSAQSGFA